MSKVRFIVRLVLTVFFGTAGIMHLSDPQFFHPQVPDFLPARDTIIVVTGGLFLAGALGLLAPARIRRYAAAGLIALLLAVWPGNWWGAIEAGSYISPGGSNLIDWIRVPFQLLFIAIVWWANRDVLTRNATGWHVRTPAHTPAR